MRMGERFWQLIAVVFAILVLYGLTSLYDFNVVQQKQLLNQQQLLMKQQAMLKGNHWQSYAKDAEKLKKAWLAYLPTERSPTSAKAKLLSDIRALAQNSGIPNVVVSAGDAEGGESVKSGNPFYADKSELGSKASSKSQSLPTQVQMIKLTINGRFDPIPFKHLIRNIDETLPFTVIDSVRVRGTQLEMGIRCYWRIEAKDEDSKLNHAETTKEL